uniref:Uncharacterized protein n=1 Tax=Phakopsora pachyrhizi TaxID=170000 RepID=A0A0S1MIX6_PHAPC
MVGTEADQMLPCLVGGECELSNRYPPGVDYDFLSISLCYCYLNSKVRVKLIDLFIRVPILPFVITIDYSMLW